MIQSKKRSLKVFLKKCSVENLFIIGKIPDIRMSSIYDIRWLRKIRRI